MPKRKDDFSPTTKRKIAERACYICSKPDCRKMTIGPHSDPKKSKNLGMAAHIKAASPEGPRYDKDQPPEERRGIMNAIWLCQKHGREVDADDSKHTVKLLCDWKIQHDAFVETGVTVPLLQAVETLTRFKNDPGTVRHVFSRMASAEVFWGEIYRETPRYVLDSLVRFRNELAESLACADITPTTRAQLEGLGDVCRTFLRDSGDLSSGRRIDEGAFENPEQFVGAMKFFRDAIYSQLQMLSTNTQVDIPQRLIQHQG
jgi:hypothetical protein